jgi:hypothetical protein
MGYYYIEIYCGNKEANLIITNSVALVREQAIPTERPPLVGEVSANFCGFEKYGDEILQTTDDFRRLEKCPE